MRRRPTAKVLAANQSKLPRSRRPLKLESLEPRWVLTSLTLDQAFGQLSSHSGVCNCPVCTGIGLNTIPVEQSAPSGPEASSPLSSLPQLHSNPGASAKLFLDFDGHFEAFWGGKSNVTTPAFDQDGDVTTFSDGELTAIYEIWARVAEDYAPFNIDVTTVDTGNQTNGVTAVIAIGGNYSDWYGSGAGGVAYVGGFSNFSSNVGYVFENALGSNAHYVAEASSHEAGHLFGLRHQALWNGTTLVDSYNPGNADWAPIMGVSYSSARSTWHDGPTNLGSTNYQDDVAVIAGGANGFGQKTDDFGNTIPFANDLAVTGTSVNFAGLIEHNADVDMWEFTTGGGQVSFTLSVAQYGANLDSIMELRDASNNILFSSDPSNSFGASITATVGAGTYYLVARGNGVYGNIGQYTMTGTLPGQSTAPEISVLIGSTAVADGGSVDFGSTPLGTAVSRTFTVRNDGSATLTLTQLVQANMPAGYTLVSGLGSTSLAVGGSTTFTVRLDAASAGTFAGSIQLASNDGDENPYDLALTGAVTAAPEITILLGSNGIADGGSVDFGSTQIGTSVSRTITVKNDGNATLTLTQLSQANMPAGYTLVSGLGSTSLAAGASTSFTISLDAASAGSFSGSIQLASNDADENPYDLTLTGSVAAPEISMFADGSGIGDGVYIDFGSTNLGSAVTKTFTIRNDGSGTLNLTSLDANSMPTGFTLTSNLSSLALTNGQTSTFTVRLDAGSAGSFSGQILVVSDDANENPFHINVLGAVTASPEISLTDSGGSLSDGGFLSFGTTTVGAAVTKTITVTNDGNATLNLTSLNPNSMPAGFTLVSNLGSTSLAPGASTTFEVRLDATAAGNFSGSISLVNNDANENPFDVTISGTVNDPSQWSGPKLIDNGGGGWNKVGSWTYVTGKGRENDIHRTNKGSGSLQSNWTFNNLPDGDYWVWVSWTGNANNASNAPFTVYDGVQAKATWRVDQRAASSGFDADGTSWRYLGIVTITSGQMVVRLTNAANNFVVADAVRIDKVFDTSPAALPAEFVSPANPTPAAGAFLASTAASQHQPALPASATQVSPAATARSSALSSALDAFYASGGQFASPAKGQDAFSLLAEHFSKRRPEGDDVDSILSDWGEIEGIPLPRLP